MSKIKLLDAAKMFAADKLNAYFEYEDYYCATDSRLLIMVPKEQIPDDEITIKTDGMPDFSFVLKNQKLDNNVPVKLGDLITKLNTVPMIDEYDDCYACDGDGKIECECCESIVDCKECDGSGQGSMTGKKELDYNYHMKVLDYYLSVYIIHRLTTALVECGYTHDSELMILSNDAPKPIIMEIDGIKIIMVGTNYHAISPENVIKVL